MSLIVGVIALADKNQIVDACPGIAAAEASKLGPMSLAAYVFSHAERLFQMDRLARAYYRLANVPFGVQSTEIKWIASWKWPTNYLKLDFDILCSRAAVVNAVASRMAARNGLGNDW